jgi:quercetin dioxygenase-like cupin family protein
VSLLNLTIFSLTHVTRKQRETFDIIQTFHPSNLPGKTIIVGTVEVPPGGATPSHRHGGASIVAVPIEGTCLNQMNGNEPIVSNVGDFWYEAPGCHHQRSECVGDKKSKFFVTMIVDDEVIKDGFGNVFVLDKEVEAGEKRPSA